MQLKNTLLVISILLGSFNNGFTQSSYSYQTEFESAYVSYPLVPEGLLEAVSFCQTRITDLQHIDAGCIGMPVPEGVMGFIENGLGYFVNTKTLIANLSGTQENNLGIPATDIMAYAGAYTAVLIANGEDPNNFKSHEKVLRYLCEIPKDENPVNNFALSAFTFQVLNFMRDEAHQSKYNFPAHSINLTEIYGAENLQILRSKKILVSSEEVKDAKGNIYQSQTKSADYGPALWVATPSCNYSSRSGTPISAVTVHTIQGSYAGAISWAQNCSANVSYHYVVRSTDGQITQMVYEADKGWHVGSENPYTIGIEHEGYVNNPAWYTTSMYTASAALVKDITQSGYGINPLRTFQGPATTGTNLLGACTKIKGHQHYANQSHTDPGINWNWEYYYQLINDNPTITALTSSSGTFFDSGGNVANYQNDERLLYLIQPAGALEVTINFVQFNLENNWDYMYVYDGATLQSPLLGVFTGTALPASITSSGAELLIEFRSDCATTASGWEISWGSVPGPVPGDVIAPTSVVTATGNWKTTNFTANFVDTDNVGGSGVHHKFYQVIDFDGTEWRANSDNGFFSDNFDLAIHPDWTSQVGTWSTVSGGLVQTDELSANTNLWASLNQDNYDKWLYHFAMNLSGAGTNKRAGFHFMCDDATLTNRGNSYFIWLRADDDKIQIYKTVNDIFQLEVDVPYVVNESQWYDIKVVYDKTTGLIQMYINDILEASWLDATPYTAGNAISFRSGDGLMGADNIKVYHNRGSSELVTINTGNDIQYQNTNPLTHAAKIKTIAIDSSANVSGIGENLVNVDWTVPSNVGGVNDGIAADINVTYTNTELSANWSTAVDLNSDLAHYWYSIGTSPLATDVVPWTGNWVFDTLTKTGLALVEGTTYYVCVYAENGAGLFSDTLCSDGQTLQAPTGVPVSNFVVPNSYICALESVQMFNSSQNAQTYEWLAPGATPTSSTLANPSFLFSSVGYYDITLIASSIGGDDTSVQTIYVNIDTIPLADFLASATVVDISSPNITFTNTSLHANGYTWNFGDGNVSNDVDPWHSFSSLGSYNVQLIAVNGLCPNDTTSQIIQVIDDLGLAVSSLFGVTIYPNPAQEIIFIELDETWTGNIDVKILDVRGRIVFEQKFIDADKIKIDLNSKIMDGVYYVQLSDTSQTGTQKIIVKR